MDCRLSFSPQRWARIYSVISRDESRGETWRKARSRLRHLVRSSFHVKLAWRERFHDGILDDLLLRLDFRDPEPEVIDLSPAGGVVSTLQESKIECLVTDKVSHFSGANLKSNTYHPGCVSILLFAALSWPYAGVLVFNRRYSTATAVDWVAEHQSFPTAFATRATTEIEKSW